MESGAKKAIFEDYKISKAFLSLVIPTIISQIIMIIYNYADTWFVGKTNDSIQVGALQLIIPVFVIMNAIANLFGIGGSSTIARSLGERNIKRAKNTFSFCIFASIGASLLYSLVLILFRSNIIYMIGGSEETFNYIKVYMFVTMILGSIPTILNNVFAHLVRSIGASKEASIGMSLGALINIILDPIFMFLILPKGNEVIGAGIATVIGNTCAMLYFIIYILKHKEIEVFSLSLKDAKTDKHTLVSILFIGFPAALSTTLAMVSNIFCNNLIKFAGTTAVAGVGLAKKTNMLAFNMCMGITQGMLPFIAYNYAQKNYARMKKGMFAMVGVAVAFSTVITCTFIMFPDVYINFFIKDSQTVEYGIKALKIIAIAVPLCSLSFSVNTVFQATNNKTYSFILSILRKGLFDIPVMFLLKPHFGVSGVLYATPIAEIAALFVAFLLIFMFFKKLRRHSRENLI